MFVLSFIIHHTIDHLSLNLSRILYHLSYLPTLHTLITLHASQAGVCVYVLEAEMRRKKNKSSTSQPWFFQGRDAPVSFEIFRYPGENIDPAHLSLGLAKVEMRRI